MQVWHVGINRLSKGAQRKTNSAGAVVDSGAHVIKDGMGQDVCGVGGIAQGHADSRGAEMAAAIPSPSDRIEAKAIEVLPAPPPR